MGSPAQPTPDQYSKLEKAGRLAQFGTPETMNVQDSVGRSDCRATSEPTSVTYLWTAAFCTQSQTLLRSER
jgi:hypothetical protein